jgi:alpha-tubulin suppressor-like RCC1 family protein
LEGETPGARAVSCEDSDPRIIDAVADVHWRTEIVHDAARIASGSDSTCVVRFDGTLRCFGAPEIAVDLSRLNDVADVAVGGQHACARHKDETLSCWGKNDHGQIGDATRLDRNVPTLVSGLTGVKHVAAGSAHTCVHRGDDTIRCWGSDSHRQLGLGGAAGDKDVPTLVPGLYEAVGIAASADFTCARMTDGWLRCWGANDMGQLGDGTNTERAVPVPIRM